MSETKHSILNCTDATISCQFCGASVPPNSDHECPATGDATIARLTAERDAAKTQVAELTRGRDLQNAQVKKSRAREARLAAALQALTPSHRTAGCWCSRGQDIEAHGHEPGCERARAALSATDDGWLEARLDRQFIAGMTAGWNYALNDDHVGYNATVEQRMRGIVEAKLEGGRE